MRQIGAKPVTLRASEPPALLNRVHKNENTRAAIGERGAAVDLMAKISRSEAKRGLQERQRAWLQWVIEQTGKRPAQIGREAEVSDTPLTRLLNNPEHTGTLSELTIERITSHYGIPGPAEYLGQRAPADEQSHTEAELLALEHLSDRAKGALALLADHRPGVETWRLRTACLEGAGYFPGDLLLVDCDAHPRIHEAVCASVRDGTPDLVWRIFDPPFLVARPASGVAPKPLLVDGDRVKVRGVVIASLRPRRELQ